MFGLRDGLSMIGLVESSWSVFWLMVMIGIEILNLRDFFLVFVVRSVEVFEFFKMNLLCDVGVLGFKVMNV